MEKPIGRIWKGFNKKGACKGDRIVERCIYPETVLQEDDDDDIITAEQGRMFARIDALETQRKYHLKFKQKEPDNLVRLINELNNELSMILAEFRRLNNILSYLNPDEK